MGPESKVEIEVSDEVTNSDRKGERRVERRCALAEGRETLDFSPTRHTTD